ncbi:MAG: RHS repeat-associated core domain-containing protein [Phycisphaerae bacterium]
MAPLDTADPGYEGYDSTWSAGYEDRSTGILHVGARDYEPATGRFLQPDPVRVGPESLAGMLNRWVYCANDPVNFSDPSGLLAWSTWYGLIGGGLGLLAGAYLMIATPVTFFAGLALMATSIALILDVLAKDPELVGYRCTLLRLRNYALWIAAAAAAAQVGIAAAFAGEAGLTAGLAPGWGLIGKGTISVVGGAGVLFTGLGKVLNLVAE